MLFAESNDHYAYGMSALEEGDFAEAFFSIQTVVNMDPVDLKAREALLIVACLLGESETMRRMMLEIAELRLIERQTREMDLNRESVRR